MLPGARKPRPSAKFAVESFDRNTHAALGNKGDRSGIDGPIHSADPVARASSAESMDSKSPEGDYNAAIAHYEAALRIQPDFVEAQQNLSFTRSLAGR